MARPTLENLRRPGAEFARDFERFARENAGVRVPHPPPGFAIERVALCALARYRDGAEYEAGVTEFIDAVVAEMATP